MKFKKWFTELFDPENDDPDNLGFETRRKANEPVRYRRMNLLSNQPEDTDMLEKGQEFYYLLKEKNPKMAHSLLLHLHSSSPEERQRIIGKLQTLTPEELVQKMTTQRQRPNVNVA